MGSSLVCGLDPELLDRPGLHVLAVNPLGLILHVDDLNVELGNVDGLGQPRTSS
jgi:hypothetical protein